MSIWQRIFGSEVGSAPPPTGPARGPDVVRLEPAIPGLLDGDSVVMGSVIPGLYVLHTGQEIYALSAQLSLETGERTRVGVGSRLSLPSGGWVVTGFSSGETMVLERESTVDLAMLALPEDSPVVFPDAEVRNLWISKDQPVVAWVADLTSAVREDPDSIALFVDTVLAAGEAQRVLEIHEVVSLGFADDDQGRFADWLKQQRTTAPDLLSELGGVRVSAELAFFNKAGRLIESPVQRLDRVLGREEPFPGAFDGLMQNHPPVVLEGSSKETMGAVQAGDWDRRVTLRIVLHSDIWFPWINGVNHPLCDYKRSFDNRLLAERHTPRLNAFLGAVADAARAAGGTFGLDKDCTNVRPEYVSDSGIVLDGPEPVAQFELNDRNMAWD
jgi:hypothetical protein